MDPSNSDALSGAVVLIHEASPVLAQSPFLARDLGLQGARPERLATHKETSP